MKPKVECKANGYFRKYRILKIFVFQRPAAWCSIYIVGLLHPTKTPASVKVLDRGGGMGGGKPRKDKYFLGYPSLHQLIKTNLLQSVLQGCRRQGGGMTSKIILRERLSSASFMME